MRKTIVFTFCLCMLTFPGPVPANGGTPVTDQAGRTVNVPDDPARVVSLAPSVTEIVFAVGRADALVGVTAYSDYPEAARTLPRVGSYFQPDLERILALTPDLCIGVADSTPPNAAARLEDLGVPVYLVNPTNLGSVMDSIIRVGRLLGVEPGARDLVRELENRVERVRLAVQKTGERPAVFYQIGSNPMHTAGGDTFINEIIEAAGGMNLCRNRRGYPSLDMEQALALEPEVILITAMGRGEFLKAKARWERWPSVPAVRTGRIYVLDSDFFDRPGPRLVNGLEQLVDLLHPKIVGARP